MNKLYLNFLNIKYCKMLKSISTKITITSKYYNFTNISEEKLSNFKLISSEINN